MTVATYLPGPALTDLIYHGALVGLPGEPQVAIVSPDGDDFGLLPHVALQSPAGFAWGYLGAGPTDLARSLLIHALGRAARCRHCHGVGTGTCCRDGYRTDLPVRDFKHEYVTGWVWGEEWQARRSELLAWLALHGLTTGDPQ